MPVASQRSRPVPRLYLAVPAEIEATAMADKLDALAAHVDIAAVLLRLPDADPRTLTERIKAFASVVQHRGAALLTDGHTDLVARGGADGAHLSGIPAMQAGMPSLKPQRIAGVGGINSRHDAMLAGEAGTDYVMFGEPAAHGNRPALEAIVERIAWWTELFEIPCVGYAASIEEAAAIAEADAEFVIVEDAIWNDPRGATAALMDASRAIGQDRLMTQSSRIEIAPE
jgi:thiamine-phosphate pyrophosphorylase